ncbi:MAG: type II 3-dehydroquinate dehydratase [Calditrichaeota bacterium]|nr:type II 3-dehydroquinate dehydratase [Calditrichota bacterium]
MKILILNGPNLNLLGSREPEIYGNTTLADIYELISSTFPEIEFEKFQSNHEGDLIDTLQQSNADCVIFNPAAYTHYSYAIADAVKAINKPVVEVHLSDISKREDFRKISVIRPNCIDQISGFGPKSYIMAVEKLISYMSENGAK